MSSRLPRHSAWPGHWYQSSTRALPAIIQDRTRQRRAWDLDRSKGCLGATRGPRDRRQNTLRQHLLIRVIILGLLGVDQQQVNELLWRTRALLGEGQQAFVGFLRQFEHLAHKLFLLLPWLRAPCPCRMSVVVVEQSTQSFSATNRTRILSRVVKNSCGFPFVVFQKAPEPFATLYRAFTRSILAARRKEEAVALPLMIALVMIMLNILLERMPEGSLTKQNKLGEALALDRLYPALRIGIQIGGLGRQWHARDTSIIDDPLKRWAVLAVSVVDEILPRSQEAPVDHGHI